MVSGVKEAWASTSTHSGSSGWAGIGIRKIRPVARRTRPESPWGRKPPSNTVADRSSGEQDAPLANTGTRLDAAGDHHGARGERMLK